MRTLLLVLGISVLHASAEAAVDYARDVQPVLAEHCLECHGPDDSKGGLTLTSRELATKILKSGVHAIVPGKPEISEVIKRIASTDPDEQMPPPKHRQKKPIQERELQVIRQWIAEGAKYDLHWAYKPIVQPHPPTLKGKGIQPIDTFVWAKLAENGLIPSPEADRVTLIRRVYYDLLGLPPSPEEVDAFLNDASPQAYEKVVDKALSSQHYGERWGRHWLDMARYADSDGYEKDLPRPDAWRYRDWVIRAINNDMRYDQFTIEQLAGDLLPNATPEQIVATAFNRQTLTNTEGGTDQEQFRVDACFDRTETLGAVWLGLTVGCARCHNHKYDQVSQREYFQLFAYFNNADEVKRQAPVSLETWNEYERKNGAEARKLIPLQKKLDEAKSNLPIKLKEWEKGIQARLAEARKKALQQQFEPLKIEKITSTSGVTFQKLEDGSYLAGGQQSKTDTYTLEIAPGAKTVTAIQIHVLPDPSLPFLGPGRSGGGNFVLSEVRVHPAGDKEPILLHSALADFAQKGYAAADAIDGKLDTGWALSGGIGKPHVLTIQLDEPIPAGTSLTLALDQQHPGGFHCIGRFRVLAASEETEASIVPANVLSILNEEPKRRNPVVIQALYAWLEKMDPDVRTAAAALEKARKRLPQPPLMDVRVMGQRRQDVRITRLLHRGDFLQPTEVVQPGTLNVVQTSLGPANETKASGAGAVTDADSNAKGTRLELAQWLTDRKHPLTARVAVNHVWDKLFGQGLVRTVADFGVRGERPSHPELLDWLAAEFMKQGWSRKWLIRTILMSATYRQSSSQNDAGSSSPELAASLKRAQEMDARNTLLWRQNRLRVEAEIVRDLGLASSGLLATKIGGPSVFPPMPADVAALSYAGNFSWKTSGGEDRYRRGMYTFFKRTAPYPELTTFDCPDANVTNVKRNVSNTPLQALATLNAEASNEMAQALAKRVLTEEAKGSDESRLVSGFRLCVSRKPTSKEVGALLRLFQESLEHYKTHADEAKQAVGAYHVPNRDDAEVAAWVATTRILLNMDEFITRE